jgi:hypothetical protein
MSSVPSKWGKLYITAGDFTGGRSVEIDEKWASEMKAYIKWECQDA